MDTIMLVVIVMGALMFLGVAALILLYWLVWFRKRTVIHILTQDMKFINNTFKKIPSVEVHCKDGTPTGGTYFYRDLKSIKSFWGTHQYNYQGIPEPIDFTQRHLIPIPRMVAEDLEKVLKSDFITKLFHGQKLEKAILLLQVITLFLAVVIIICQFALKPSGYSKLDPGDNVTYDIIKNACGDALKNGLQLFTPSTNTVPLPK